MFKLSKKGVLPKNLDTQAYDTFTNDYNDFLKIHASCGPHCKHLMKFYHKIGFFKFFKHYSGMS